MVVPGLSGRPFLCQFVGHIRNISSADPIDPKYFFMEKHKILVDQEHLFKNKILILTRKLDTDAGPLGAELWNRKIDYVRFNIDDIPSFVQLSYTLSQSHDPAIDLLLRGQ